MNKSYTSAFKPNDEEAFVAWARRNNLKLNPIRQDTGRMYFLEAEDFHFPHVIYTEHIISEETQMCVNCGMSADDCAVKVVCDVEPFTKELAKHLCPGSVVVIFNDTEYIALAVRSDGSTMGISAGDMIRQARQLMEAEDAAAGRRCPG